MTVKKENNKKPVLTTVFLVPNMKAPEHDEQNAQTDSLYSIYLENKDKEHEKTNEDITRIYGKKFKEKVLISSPPARRNEYVEFLRKDENKQNFIIFQQSTKALLFWGQCWGLNPVQGITKENPLDVQFQKDSLRFWYTIFIWICQAIVSSFSLVSLFCSSTNVMSMVHFCIYFSTCTITSLCVHTASKWPEITQQIAAASKLDVNANIKNRCILVLVVFICIAFVEHVFAVIANVAFVLDCYDVEGDQYGRYIKINYSFLFDFGLPYHFTVGIFLQFLTLACTVNWNYTDMFIITISIYLISVLQEVNKKIWTASKDSLPPSTWKSLRETYTFATRLVRSFDNAINHVIFVSFATSLFFVCLQLFNVLSSGLRGRIDENCTNFPRGPFNGHEHSIYYFVSLVAVLVRSLSVALVAAEVHTTSKAALPALYEVPTGDFSDEVQRLIEQIHGDTVALSGFGFFNLTKDLVLNVAGTIITYELVLLQFKQESALKTSEPNFNAEKLNLTM